jgi:hypothetical protein
VKNEMTKFIYFFKKIFIPLFTYEYYSSLPNSSYLNNAAEAIRLF